MNLLLKLPKLTILNCGAGDVTLSLNEMMIQFVGRCWETHRIKNKPIGEGFKFFVLATMISLPKVIKDLRNKGIGVVGTLRFRQS